MKFTSLEVLNEENIIFGDSEKGKIIEIDKICIIPSTFIENNLLIDGLKYNILSISQFCDRSFKVIFESSCIMHCF